MKKIKDCILYTVGEEDYDDYPLYNDSAWTNIYLGHNGPGTEKHTLWFDDDLGNCEPLTMQTLQTAIDETGDWLVKLIKLRDKIKETV